MCQGLICPVPAGAQTEERSPSAKETGEPPDPAAELQRLEEQLRRTEELHTRQMLELKERLAALEAQMAAAGEARQQEDLAALMAEAEELTAGEIAREAEAAGRARDLSSAASEPCRP